MHFLWVLAACTLTWRLYVSHCHLSKIPKGIPWANGRFTPYLLTQISAIWNCPKAIGEAYTKYSKNGLICAFTWPFSRPEILLPQTHISWIISQSDKILSPTPLQHGITGVKYSFWDGSMEKDFVAYDILHVKLKRHLPQMVPMLMKELASSVDGAFGSGTEWKEVQAYLPIRRVILKLSTLMVFGGSLNDNEDLLDNLSKFSSAVVPSALVLSFFPPFLQPILSHLTSFFNRMYMKRAIKTVRPEIERRITSMERGNVENIPQDNVLTWHIEQALRKKEPREGLADVIACRVFATMFAALESTTLTMTHTLFNICATDPAKEVWKALEEEGRSAFSAKVDQSTVNSLKFADSAIKETLRLHTSIKALGVQVMQPAGLDLQGYDIHLPQGSRVSVPVWGIHHDEDIYPAAHNYEAFRFVQDGESEDSLVSPSETYLSFGLGKHSCPGRNFAAIVMKLFLADLAVHYDVEAVHERPVFMSIGHFPIPPIKGRVRIRRKQSIGQD
ncbi:hypothetical protein NW766_007329 [Fusarium irregulare]|uniref:Cytochrome P450 n=1 Tax=Fusarium irregulare TaxID=2494466 RepID=A0A9W8PMX4_9HYPO|nr:hypothetical protein NW766_007329 [Fusarium irregulare]